MLDVADLLCQCNPFFCLVVIIGLQQSNYEIPENDGPLLVCAMIESGELKINIHVQMEVLIGSASLEDVVAELEPLTFSPQRDVVCRNVTIMNDLLFEENEVFSIDLQSNENGTVHFSTSMANITILNDDGMYHITLHCIVCYNKFCIH